MKSPCYLTDFKIIRPQHEIIQEFAMEWMVEAHTRAEKTISGVSFDEGAFKEKIRQRLNRVAAKPAQVAKRGHELNDFLHTDWANMSLYNLDTLPNGAGLFKRQLFYQETVDAIFERFYPEEEMPPSDIVHVSCTGYASPSGAQKLASARGWNDTLVTHAYHMGCYAAIPAIRMAAGFVAQGSKRADVVHTELCTIHKNPLEHADDQLVVHSLFADGFIRYTVLEDPKSSSSLKVLAVNELLIPNSSEAMQWRLSDWGFKFTLSKEIPYLIASSLIPFIQSLAVKANLPLSQLLEKALFAIHPGGPKILDNVQKLLGLAPWQMETSRGVLKEFGNMSSATLPHIWTSMCGENDVAKGTKIVSLAFGPGLTIAGILLEKV